MAVKFKKILFSGAALAAPLLCAAQPVRAQVQEASEPSSSSGTTLAEIVVTANKREERLNSVGMTITALSGQSLTDRGITDLSNIASVVPGLSFAQSSSNTPILTLRGVGFNSNVLGSYPAVSLYNDQMPLPFPVLGTHAAYDLQRIEVLKGPQGTLFGQNSTGGAINFIAAKPTAAVEAEGDISYGRFNDVQVNAYLSGPLSDTLRGRIAGNFEHSDGWQISATRPYDRNGAKSYGAARLILDWDASDRIRFSFNANGWIDKSEPPAPQFIGLRAQTPTPQVSELTAPFSNESPRAADWSTGEWKPQGDRKFYQLGLRSDFDLTDRATLTALTSYAHFTQKQTEDIDGLPLLINAFHESGNIESFNQEVRIANAATESLRWVVGANYESSKTFNYQLNDFRDSSTAIFPFTAFDSTFEYVRQKIRNEAGFANLEYDLSSKLTAKGGVRYTESKNSASMCSGDGGDGTLVNFVFNISGITGVPLVDCLAFDAVGGIATRPTDLTLKEHNVSWRTGLDYKMSDGTLLYANVSRGYKAGSFPLYPVSTVLQYQPVTQEAVTSYEAGIKADLFDRHAHINTAAFYYNYEDKQILGNKNIPPFGINPVLVNVPKSRIFGLEGDVTVKPTGNLTLTGSVTYLDTRIQRFFDIDAAGNPLDLAGSKLPFAPKFSYDIDAEYRGRLANGGTPFIGISVTGRSSEDTTIGGSSFTLVPGPLVRIEPGLAHPFTTNPYALVDLRFGYEAPGSAWRVMLFGRNIFNKYYWNNVNAGETIVRFAGEPATYGVTLGLKF